MWNNEFEIGSIVVVSYKEDYRLAKVIEFKHGPKGERHKVEFFDNGEHRNYRIWDKRLTIATPDEIVKWRQNERNRL